MSATSEEQSELAELRAEVARLRREMNRVNDALDLPDPRDPEYEPRPYGSVEFGQMCVRHDKKRLPVIVYSGEDESGVFLYDAKQRLRGAFVIGDDDLARLEIRNAEGEVVVRIGESADKRGEIIVHEADGTPRAGLKVSDFGGVVSIVDEKGRALAAMTNSATGGQFFLTSPQQKVAVSLKSVEAGGYLSLHDISGRLMGFLGVTPVGAAMTLHSEQGDPAVTLGGIGAAGGTVVLFNEDGEIKAGLP